jgi:hypothetical protein
LEEVVPDFDCLGAEEQEVVHIFIQVAGETGSRGRKVVSKPSLVSGQTPFPSKPAEDLAL